MSHISIAIHTLGVALFGCSLYYYFEYVDPPKELVATNKNIAALKLWPGKWKYLTLWNAVLQLAYQVIALLNDIIGSSEVDVQRQKFLQKIRDGYFAAWVFPTSMLVCITFWTLYTINRNLIFPPEMDIFYPSWLNHVVHTGPILFLNLDSYFVPKIFPSKVVGYSLNILFSITYAGWIIWVHHISNVWPYPILGVLDTNKRRAFIGAIGIVLLAFCYFGERLNKWRWGSAVADFQLSQKKGKKKSN